MRRLFEFGGYVAAVILIAFGVTALVLGINGRSDVQDNLAREKIEGSPDMTPEGIRQGVQEAGITVSDLPDCSVAGKLVDSGDEAHCFAQYMRVHALESSGGLVYAEMGRFLSADDPENLAGTSDEEAALLDDEGNPVPNGARNTWVTETALATALNMAFFAEQVSNFSLVVAIALILAGIGFGVLAFAALRWLPAYEARRSSA
jgi:hypothetical protein